MLLSLRRAGDKPPPPAARRRPARPASIAQPSRQRRSATTCSSCAAAKPSPSTASRPEAVAKRHALGLRTARENIADLCDAGSFVEYGALAFAAQQTRRARSTT